MRKLLILLLVAAAVGIVMSRERGAGTPPGQADGEAAVAQSGGDASEQGTALADEPMVEALAMTAAQAAQQAQVGQQSAPERQDAAGPAPVVLSANTAQAKAATVRTGPPAVSAAISPQELAAAMDEVGSLLEAGKWPQARGILTELYLGSRGKLAAELRALLDQITKELVFNPRCVEGATIHIVQRGENLTKIGKKYGVNGLMIGRINGMQGDRLRAEQKLKILTGRTSVVIYKSEYRLALLLDGLYVREYPVGIGKDDRTPTGKFVVDNMLVQPDWYPPGGGVIKYGEEGYQLGERWIGFADEPGAAGLGIHGTEDQQSIGTKCSNGCIRLTNDDVMELYDFVQIGSPIQIRE